MTTHYLRTWSTDRWMDWSSTTAAAAALGLSEWLWADLRGLQHADALPDDAPITGCLWGWTGGRTWARLRVDVPLGGAPRVCGAVLDTGVSDSGEGVTVVPADPVPVFRSSHFRGNAAALDDRMVRCLRVMDRPLTFVELT